jgi:hypothetical protein
MPSIFLCLLLFCSAVALSSSVSDPAGSAFYILFATQIDSTKWPRVCQNDGIGPQGAHCVNATHYENGAFVLSPQNVTREHIAKIKGTAKNAKVLAYWDFHNIALLPSNKSECPFCTGHVMGDRLGRNCSTTYSCGENSSSFSTKLRAAFPTKLAVHDITNGTPGIMVESYPGLATYVWSKDSATMLSAFLAETVKNAGFDGIYFDGYVQPDLLHFSTASAYNNRGFFKPGHLYDLDGDGVPDDPAEANSQYFAWAPAFVAMMRSKLGDNATIIGNSAGSVSDSNLNGVTIEMEACTGTSGVKRCSDALTGQQLATTLRHGDNSALSVLWLTHAESMSPAQQCAEVSELQAKLPFVLAGTDFFDGSAIVCP